MSERLRRLARLAGLVVISSLVGCGPERYGDWMIGLFSGPGEPGPTRSDLVALYEIGEDGAFEYREVVYDEVILRIERTWEHIDADSIMVAPGPTDEVQTREHERWVITRVGRCGPHEYWTYRNGSPIASEPSHIHRGEMCVRAVDEPCNGECDCCEYYWCEPPPPCDEG